MDNRHFSGYLRRHFVGNGSLDYIVRRKIITFVRGNVNSCVRVSREMHEHWSPTNNDSTVL